MLKMGVLLKLGCLCVCLPPLAGCGTFGGTKIVEVRLANPPAGPLAQVDVGNVALADHATKLDADYVIPVGEFSTADLNNITISLSNAVQSVQSAQGVDSGRRLTLYVLLRRYLVTSSNTAGAVLACVAWCAVDEGGKIVWAEQFYSSGLVVVFGTLGGVKNTVNLGIVRRITEVSSHLASREANKTPLPPFPENTFGDFVEATKNLPEEFVSVQSFSTSRLAVSNRFEMKAGWSWAKCADGINWPAYLKTHGAETKR